MRRKRWVDRSPLFLPAETSVRVRFQEADALGIVWHGHYLTYFEDGRNAFGRQYSFDYSRLRREGFIVPIVRIEAEFFAPARFDEVLRVEARLHPAEGAWIPFTYIVRDGGGRTLAKGSSVQVFTDLDGTLVLTQPGFYREFLERWKERMVEG